MVAVKRFDEGSHFLKPLQDNLARGQLPVDLKVVSCMRLVHGLQKGMSCGEVNISAVCVNEIEIQSQMRWNIQNEFNENVVFITVCS